MKGRCALISGVIALLFLFSFVGYGQAFTIDFEGLPDTTPLSNQYSGLGVTFSNATILTAGKSLNELEFPPHSGINVVIDDGGPILLDFSTPVVDAGGYFTYLSPVTLTAYDSLNSVVATISSAYLSNLALSGDPGSSPNEFLELAYGGGISQLQITGDPSGSSFTLDDFTATPVPATPVPEPHGLLLLGSGLVGITILRKRKVGIIDHTKEDLLIFS